MKVVPKRQEFEAFQWVGDENCEEMFRFLGWEHPAEEMDHSQMWVDIFPNGVLDLGQDSDWPVSQLVGLEPGVWFLKDSEGQVRVVENDVFQGMFDEVGPEVNEKDFRVDLYRTNVKTSVMVRHLPSGHWVMAKQEGNLQDRLQEAKLALLKKVAEAENDH